MRAQRRAEDATPTNREREIIAAESVFTQPGSQADLAMPTLSVRSNCRSGRTSLDLPLDAHVRTSMQALARI